MNARQRTALRLLVSASFIAGCRNPNTSPIAPPGPDFVVSSKKWNIALAHNGAPPQSDFDISLRESQHFAGITSTDAQWLICTPETLDFNQRKKLPLRLSIDTATLPAGSHWAAASISGNGLQEAVIRVSITRLSNNRREKNMVLIEAKDQSFTIGDTAIAYAYPLHNVSFRYNFWIDTVEVTQHDYHSLMNVNPSSVKGSRLPVHTINWYDAVLYCNAKSKAEGLDAVYAYTAISGERGAGCALSGLETDYAKNGYRLPTESEWEFACRAGEFRRYFWGNSLNDAFCWCDEPRIQPTTVASPLPNAYGLYDMAGNVAEWCGDWYGAYSSCYKTDPRGCENQWCNGGGAAPSHDIDGSRKVVRGGSYDDYAINVASAKRFRMAPRNRNAQTGFRCVRLSED